MDDDSGLMDPILLTAALGDAVEEAAAKETHRKSSSSNARNSKAKAKSSKEIAAAAMNDEENDNNNDDSDDNEESASSSKAPAPVSTDKPKKRKKAARACNHCQTAHLTCDDNRPCGRCVKRNLGETCQDGVRKKAKYLRDIDDEVVNAGKAHPTNFAPASHEHTTTSSASQPLESPSLLPDHLQQQQQHRPHLVPMGSSSLLTSSASPNPFATISSSNNNANAFLPSPINQPSDHSPDSTGLNSNLANNSSSALIPPQTVSPYSFFNDFSGSGDFGSNGANLEYAVLSSMLNNAGFGSTSPNPPSSGLPSNNNNIFPSINSGYGDQSSSIGGMQLNQQDQFGDTSFSFSPSTFQTQSNDTLLSNVNNHPSTSSSRPSESPYRHDSASLTPLEGLNNNGHNQMTQQQQQQQQQSSSVHNHQRFLGKLIDHNWAPAKPTPMHPSQNSHILHDAKPYIKPLVSPTGVMRIEDVYKHVNKPYNYLEGYHALIRYLQHFFKSKTDTLRIIRSISIYRPSLIALQMPLTLDDEIFVERSFQRTLIEMEKLISFSGTPTVVWRRTGEIVLVGTEFTLLSEWKREDLLLNSNIVTQQQQDNSANGNKPKERKAKRRYIFEIFDNLSTVEYYESFAAHAFENSSSTIMSTVKIVTPAGRKVPCTFGYNLKRDIFGLPSMVIGQFLPILGGSS